MPVDKETAIVIAAAVVLSMVLAVIIFLWIYITIKGREHGTVFEISTIRTPGRIGRRLSVSSIDGDGVIDPNSVKIISETYTEDETETGADIESDNSKRFVLVEDSSSYLSSE